jgi:HSP20 family protein
MALIRWNPNTDLFNLHNELDRVFSDLTASFLPMPNGGSANAGGFLPLDIHRTETALEIEASVPGFRPEDVNLTLDNGVLTITAERSQEAETQGKNYIRRERQTGRLYRQVVIGEEVDGDNVQAGFKDGVLTITAPLVKKPEPKRIPVSSE